MDKKSHIDHEQIKIIEYSLVYLLLDVEPLFIDV
jgi:hypothetical protein